ncbi:MAG: cation transporter [Nitrospirae bacterium]|nr:MAG: cation transporter [Nitrospirota bacterium]
MDRTAEIKKVLLITLFLNAAVSAAKVIYGYLAGSVAITSDGYHSLFDGVSNVVGLIAIRMASHPPDECHPYGHRKYETVFTIFVGVLMLFTCYGILRDVYKSFAEGTAPQIGMNSFALMLATMAVNIFVAVYERRKGDLLRSEFLIADSRHTMTDIYVTLGVMVSLVFISLGYPMADPIAGMVVGLFVAKAGIGIIRESAETLIDRAQTDKQFIKKIVETVAGVSECHDIRTRGTREQVFVDLHLLVDPKLSVEEAHSIAHRVEEKIKRSAPEVIDVVVHIEPA